MVELVTIGITAFNAAPTIERAVRSALAQSWRPVEILIVDDCSEDATPEILDGVATRTPGDKAGSSGRESRDRSHTEQDLGGSREASFSRSSTTTTRVCRSVSRPSGNALSSMSVTSPAGHPSSATLPASNCTLMAANGSFPRWASERDSPAPAGLPRRGKSFVGQTAQGRLWRLRHMLANGTIVHLRDRGRLRSNAGADCEDTDLNVRLAMAGAHFVGMARAAGRANDDQDLGEIASEKSTATWLPFLTSIATWSIVRESMSSP